MLVSANIFQPLISVFASVIVFFHKNVGISWGWSIILLTICVRLVLVPLAIKQYHSMRRLQQHQPELKALQARYKDDRERQQQELMKFYKENNVNPFASCLPMLLQLPVFISLFYMLKKNLREDICPTIQANFRSAYAKSDILHNHVTSAVAKAAAAGQTTACGKVPGAGFLFIHDITNTATGLTLVVLLVLYVGTQMVSTLIMAGPTMDKNQQRMMMLMPVLFVLFIIRFPSGLIVYWITTNAWTMFQQFTLKMIMGGAVLPVGNVAVATEELKEEEQNLSSRLRRLARPSSNSQQPPASQNGRTGRTGAPPPSPRKKKKRSGRRR
ncbi:MAG TPA: YidC/Oxa1 family membrane protein insertase [Solirubrobacteraceae bacterium]|nr:YidC/Oxa1 family membrane protein insertase [Solirubrobacteraceae bacterium]